MTTETELARQSAPNLPIIPEETPPPMAAAVVKPRTKTADRGSPAKQRVHSAADTIDSPMLTDCPGLIPQVTVGSIDAASKRTRSS